MSLVNKTVKIKDVDLILFFYPDYVKRTELSLYDIDNDVLFVGEYSKTLIPSLIKGTKSFINTAGPHNIDLTEKPFIVKFVAEMIGKSEPHEKYYNHYSEDEFYKWIKVSYMLKKFIKEEKEVNYFDFFQSFMTDIPGNLRSFFNQLEQSPHLDRGVLTFLDRVCHIEEQNVSPAYLKLLVNFEKNFNKDKISRLIPEVYAKHLNPSSHLLDFILELRVK